MDEAELKSRVVLPPEMVAGVFANGFNIFQDSDDFVFLDFFAWSASDQRGRVVARIRINNVMLRQVLICFKDFIARRTQ